LRRIPGKVGANVARGAKPPITQNRRERFGILSSAEGNGRHNHGAGRCVFAILLWISRVQTLAAVLIAVILSSPPHAGRLGDRLQVALPLLAWACAGSQRQGHDFFLRYVAMFTVAHGTKLALGDMPINQRPRGDDRGFPSAHTSTAALGASRLVSDCLRGHPVMQGAVVLSAAFVGGSRVMVNAHDMAQVLAGVVLGIACDRLRRRRAATPPWRHLFAGIALFLRGRRLRNAA
jgi:membrane-associated phospholipid phosphatase